jgi:hypothetical protein
LQLGHSFINQVYQNTIDKTCVFWYYINKTDGVVMSEAREAKRKTERQIVNIVAKAKVDMNKWMLALPSSVTEAEVLAWQAGYIAGINRMANENLED